jgi:HK97 family phage portal protein
VPNLLDNVLSVLGLERKARGAPGGAAPPGRAVSGPLPVSGYSAFGGYAGGMGSTAPIASPFADTVPWHLNPVVAAGVAWFARNFPVPDIHVVRDGGPDDGAEIDDHWLPKKLDRPNELWSFFDFFAASVMSDITDGNTFWLKRKDRAGRVVDLWWLEPWGVQVVPDPSREKAILSYRYQSGNVSETYRPDEVVHVRAAVPDRADPRRGQSPLSAVDRSIRVTDEVCRFDEAILKNGGASPGFFTPADPEQPIPTEDIPKLQAWYRKNQTGPNAGSPGFAPFALKFVASGYSPEELSLDKLPRRHVSFILAAIGLSPMVLGYEDDAKSYANYAEACRAAYENGLMPMQARFMETINHDPDLIAEGERAQMDYSKVSYLQEDRGAKIHSLVEAVGGPILEKNEARAELHYEPIEEPEPPVAPPVAPPDPAAPDDAKPDDAKPDDTAKPAEDATQPGRAAKAIVPTDAEIRLKTAAVLDALQARLGGVPIPPESKYNPSHDRAGRFAAGRGGGRGVGGGSAPPHPVPPVEAHEVAELRGKVEAHAKAGGGVGRVVVGPPLDRADEKVMEKAHEKGKVAVSVTARPILKTTRDADSTTHTSRGSVTATVTRTDSGTWAVHNNTRTLVRGQLDLQPVGEHRTRRQAERHARKIAGARVEEYTRVDRSGVSSLAKLKLGNKGSPQDATFTVRVLRPYGHALNGKADDRDGLEIKDEGPAEAKCDDDGAYRECATCPEGEDDIELAPTVEAEDSTPDGQFEPADTEPEPVESNGQPVAP